LKPPQKWKAMNTSCLNEHPQPTRPDASQPSPEIVNRWNTMFQDHGNTGLKGQMIVHANVCDVSSACGQQQIPSVHKTSDFVLWHRAFMYYHEQILCASGNSDVGLPYWNWTVNDSPPIAYDASQFCFGDNLARFADTLGSDCGDLFTQQSINALVATLCQLSPAQAAIDLSSDPRHTLVHNWFGWQTSNFLQTAAGDPLFFGHHGNLDRLASHIFGKIGWPPTTGFSYPFYCPGGAPICTPVDRFAQMPSTYAGDQQIDIEGFRFTNLKFADKLGEQRLGSYNRVRIKVSFSRPLETGFYQLVAGDGTPLGPIASIMHGESDFIAWLTFENYQKATAEGIKVGHGDATGKITHAVLVTKDD
jgi:hypothetical protein